MTISPSARSSAPPGSARHEERRLRRVRTADLLDEAQHTAPGDHRDDLLNEVVVENRGVAEAVAARFRDRGVPMEDLQQTAYEGLLKAVRRFDPEQSEDLLTFAVPTIRGEIQRYFRDHGWTVRPPRRIQRLRGELHTATEDLSQRLGREPTRAEIVDFLDITTEEYDAAAQAQGCLRPASLDQPLPADTGASLGDLLPGDASDEPSEDRVVVSQLIQGLGERDRLILKLRFVDDLTQAQIGERLGVTQMQVSRLLSSILRQLREEIER